MVFSSLVFLFVFLPLLLVIYYGAAARFRNAVALVGSYLFYAWGEPVFVFVLFLSSLVDYGLSRLMPEDDGKESSKRKLVLSASIFFNVGVLFFFKYANFAVAQFSDLFISFGRSPIHWEHIALPIGISFFTFQKLSYMVDVYRGVVAPARSFSTFALYVALFPQLIAGPIIRYHDVARQLESRQHSVEKFSEGIWRFVLGLSKKVLIANVMGYVADAAFNPRQMVELPSICLWLGVIAYAYQIYFDFSGYSDMAIGLGRMMGFEFLENFNRPYIALSFTDFWHRWHISLSNWMREYLYIPLGGNRKSPSRTYINLWIVFLLSGLWHGAAWTFVIWGAYHGLFLTLEKIWAKVSNFRLPAPIRQLLTFLLVCFGWIFFRADSLGQALDYLTGLFRWQTFTFSALPYSWLAVLNNRVIFVYIVASVISFWPINEDALRSPYRQWQDWLAKVPIKHSLGIILFVLSVCSLVNMEFNPFIYFRF